MHAWLNPIPSILQFSDTYNNFKSKGKFIFTSYLSFSIRVQSDVTELHSTIKPFFVTLVISSRLHFQLWFEISLYNTLYFARDVLFQLWQWISRDNLFTQRVQSLGFYSRLLGPVSDHVFINRVSKQLAMHQVISVSENPRFLRCRFCDAIWRKKVAFENFSTVHMDKRTLRSKIRRARTFETSWDFANWSSISLLQFAGLQTNWLRLPSFIQRYPQLFLLYVATVVCYQEFNCNPNMWAALLKLTTTDSILKRISSSKTRSRKPKHCQKASIEI